MQNEINKEYSILETNEINDIFELKYPEECFIDQRLDGTIPFVGRCTLFYEKKNTLNEPQKPSFWRDKFLGGCTKTCGQTVGDTDYGEVYSKLRIRNKHNQNNGIIG